LPTLYDVPFSHNTYVTDNRQQTNRHNTVNPKTALPVYRVLDRLLSGRTFAPETFYRTLNYWYSFLFAFNALLMLQYFFSSATEQ